MLGKAVCLESSLMLRALIFDFDGLLVDTETVLIDAWAQIHEADNVTYDRGHMHHIVGHADIPHDAWIAYPSHVNRKALEDRYRIIARQLSLAAPMLPGALDLITAAREAGLHIGLASNSSHRHVEEHLDHRHVRALFDCICCRDDVARGKPAPDVYLAALNGLGVHAHEAVAFEDSEPGHTAAHRAGLFTVVVPNPSTAHGAFPHANLKLSSLAAITLADLSRYVS
jgi:putative hydrolase of the HAD superfamily